MFATCCKMQNRSYTVIETVWSGFLFVYTKVIFFDRYIVANVLESTVRFVGLIYWKEIQEFTVLRTAKDQSFLYRLDNIVEH